MTGAALVAHLALLSIISFGGIPAVLPDIHNYVIAHGWLSDREFADDFAIAQALPGPNMILMMSLIGWQVGGLPVAIASALVTFGPPCVLYYAGYRLWDRCRGAAWQPIVRQGLVPVTIGLVLGAGIVMARTAAAGWPYVAVTVVAALLALRSRINPLWSLMAGGVLGGLGLL
jgi:chromate transporter